MTSTKIPYHNDNNIHLFYTCSTWFCDYGCISYSDQSYLLQKRKGKSKIIRPEIAGWQQKGENSRVNNHNKKLFFADIPLPKLNESL